MSYRQVVLVLLRQVWKVSLEGVSVLVSAGMGFIILVACIVLCFGFRVRVTHPKADVLVVAERFLHEVKVFSASHAALRVSRLGGTRSWKETGQQTQGISHTIWCHAQCINQEESWPRPLLGK